MKTTSTLALSALFLNSFVVARPSLNHNHHAHLHKKREMVVVTEEVVETVTSTTTIWVDPTPIAAAAEVSSSVGGFFYEHHSHQKSPSSSPAAYTPPAYTPPAYTPSSVEAPESSSVYVAPSSVYTPPPAPTSVYTPPPVPSSAYTPPPASSAVYTPPPASSVYTPPPVASSVYSAPAAPSSTPYGGGGGQTYSGDITYYNPSGGYGACGWKIQDSDHQVAIAHGMMGEQSNGNPWCGKKIAISHNGQTFEATVGDKCGGCEGQSIDITQGLWDTGFTDIDGRGHNIEWSVIG